MVSTTMRWVAGLLVGAILVASSAREARAQDGCSYIAYGAVLTAAQWNECFKQKQNGLGYAPVNRAGDVMLGKLTTMPSQSSGAGFNVPQGQPPVNPQNGDIWTTITGMYARINGITVGPFGAISPSSFAATAPLSVAFPLNVVTYSLNTDQNFSVTADNLALSASGIAYPPAVSGGAKGDGTINLGASGLYNAGTAPSGSGGGYVLSSSPTVSNLTVTGSLTATGLVANSDLANPSTTVNGQSCILGASCTVTAAATDVAVGTTTVSGGTGGRFLFDNAGVLGEVAPTGTGDVVLATAPTVSDLTVTGSFTATGLVGNSALVNSSTTVNGQSCALGGSCTTAAAAGTLTGSTLAANVTASSLTSVGTLTAGSTGAGFTVDLGASTISGDLTGANVAANTIANLNLAQSPAVTLKGNPTNATANAADFTISGLTQLLAPDASNDMLLIWDSAAGTLKKINPATIASSSVAGVASIDGMTGVFTTSGGVATSSNDIHLDDVAADSVLMNATGGPAAPSGVAIPNCSGAAKGLTYDTSAHSWGCTTNTTGTVTSVGVTAGTGITQSGSPVTGSGNITVNVDKASTSNIWSAASNKVLTSDTVFNAAGAFVSLSGTSSVTPDFSTGFNFEFTATSATNYTLANPTNAKVGQTGCIYLVQPASGSVVTISYGSNWKSAGGSSGNVLTATLGAVDRVCYFVRTTSFIDFTMANDIK